VFKIKHGVNGEIEHYKAKLMARCFTHPNIGVDYNEIFTPIAKFVSICCILALQPLKTWKFESNLDNKTTFCNGDLDEEIYME
jgi:hypothetical protein